MVLLIIIPFLNGYFIGNINPTFSVTNPFLLLPQVMSHLAKERRVQLAAPPAQYSEVARSEARSDGEARRKGGKSPCYSWVNPLFHGKITIFFGIFLEEKTLWQLWQRFFNDLVELGCGILPYFTIQKGQKCCGFPGIELTTVVFSAKEASGQSCAERRVYGLQPPGCLCIWQEVGPWQSNVWQTVHVLGVRFFTSLCGLMS